MAAQAPLVAVTGDQMPEEREKLRESTTRMAEAVTAAVAAVDEAAVVLDSGEPGSLGVCVRACVCRWAGGCVCGVVCV